MYISGFSIKYILLFFLDNRIRSGLHVFHILLTPLDHCVVVLSSTNSGIEDTERNEMTLRRRQRLACRRKLSWARNMWKIFPLVHLKIDKLRQLLSQFVYFLMQVCLLFKFCMIKLCFFDNRSKQRTNTQIFSPDKNWFSPMKNTFQNFFDFCLPLFYATFQCGPYNILKEK